MYYKYMREHFIASLKVSLEWRVIAFVITNLFLWLVTKEFWEATWVALALQTVLFVVHFVWVFFRFVHAGAPKP